MQKLINTLTETENCLRAVGEDEQAQRLAGLRESLADAELRVVVFGEFNRGKSTLINALLRRFVLPAKLIPTTGHVTRVVFGTNEEVRVRYTDGRVLTCALNQLDSFSSLSRDGLAREDVDSIEVVVNSPLLREKLILVDTPGVKEHEAQTRRAVEAISKADLVLLILDARQLLSGNERDLAVDWLTKKLGKAVVTVVNFMNSVEPGERGEVRAHMDRWSGTHIKAELGKPWFEVNALGALTHALGKGGAPGDDFEALLKALESCGAKMRPEVQRRSRRGQLLYEVREAREKNRGLLQRLREDSGRVEQERKELRANLREQSRQFEATAKLGRESVKLTAQKELSQRLGKLTGFYFTGESQERLKAKANGWYEEQLTEAIRQIEKEGHASLLSLAGENLKRPEPLTIRERMILNSRLNVGELPLVGASDSAIGWGMGLGATLGTFVLPVVGTAIGAFIGGVLAGIFGSKQPDYVAAYREQANTRWAADTQTTVRILQEQYDARVGEMQRLIAERLKAIDSASGRQPIVKETRQREALDVALDGCESELLRD
jgi:predicted GTPase